MEEHIRNRKLSPWVIENLELILTHVRSIQGLADRLGVNRSSIYYWINKLELDLDKINKEKKKIYKHKRYKIKRGRPRSYHSFLTEAVRRGEMTQKDKWKALNNFYRKKDESKI